jgi:hypothetical protein
MVRLSAQLKYVAKAVGLGRLKWRMLRELRWLRLTLPLRVRQPRFVADPASRLIVSVTTSPARIARTWVALEHLLRQDVPFWKVVLVLAEDELPDKRIPRSIQRQVARGVEILWIARSVRSFNKMLPVRARYPEAIIVTMDDDIAYEPWRVGRLMEAARARPGTIIGHRGWEMGIREGALTAYETWQPAGPHTPSDRCFLTGVGGVLYPPNVLPTELLLDAELAVRLTPTNDDIWFWAVARVAGVAGHCLGEHALRGVPQAPDTPALSHRNWGERLNDHQLQAVCHHFGLDPLPWELAV